MARERLAERRRELGLSQEDIAQTLGVDAGTYGRYERGLMTPRPVLHRRLADVLNWDPAQLAVALSDDLPSVNGHEVPGWLSHLASLEQGAAEVRAFEPVVVHGLLQTADYAMAVEIVGPEPLSVEHVQRKVESRLARQLVLGRGDDPLGLCVVLDESVLRRVAGSGDVMAAQLEHLATVGEWPNVDLRVLAFDAGVFSAAFGSFSLYVQPGATDPYMAVTEDRSGPHYLDRAPEREAHTALFAYLSERALSPTESGDLIRRIAKEYR